MGRILCYCHSPFRWTGSAGLSINFYTVVGDSNEKWAGPKHFGPQLYLFYLTHQVELLKKKKRNSNQMILSATRLPFFSLSSNENIFSLNLILRRKKRGVGVIRMSSNRSKNRKPLQKGRNLSIEAIQTVQALKRANKGNSEMVERVFESKVRRLLKFDMIATLKELLRQNEPLLALKVFEDVRREYWYKPQLLLYADMIQMLANNNLLEKVDLLVFYLKIEMLRLDADINTEGFNVLLQTLMDYGFTTHAMECFQLMKEVECDLNEATFKILVIGLESKGETGLSTMLRKEAQKYIGWPLECLEQKEEMGLISD